VRYEIVYEVEGAPAVDEVVAPDVDRATAAWWCRRNMSAGDAPTVTAVRPAPPRPPSRIVVRSGRLAGAFSGHAQHERVAALVVRWFQVRPTWQRADYGAIEDNLIGLLPYLRRAGIELFRVGEEFVAALRMYDRPPR
jgi:hypothetical protein